MSTAPTGDRVIPLWNQTVPHAQGTEEKDTPTLTPFLPNRGDEAALPAIIICPGGGYGMLAVNHEGETIGEWFRARGVAAFMLRYRLPGNSEAYRHPVPLLDAQRAIRLVRSRAAEWKIDPHRLAIMGFSAGGHLVSTVATHFDAGQPSAADPVDRPSSRPDFVILVYPVISMKEGVTHAGSRNNLLGPEPDPTLIAHLSNETQVTPQTPPTLLIHSVDDLAVPIENSRLMLAALQTAQVPCELHEYPTGGHGFGYDPTDAKSTAPPQWLDRTYDWLTCHGFTTAGDHD